LKRGTGNDRSQKRCAGKAARLYCARNGLAPSRHVVATAVSIDEVINFVCNAMIKADFSEFPWSWIANEFHVSGVRTTRADRLSMLPCEKTNVA
jgi:hypothetical protein